MILRYFTFEKVKDTLRTFQPENCYKLRTPQPEKKFAGPYKKKKMKSRTLFYRSHWESLIFNFAVGSPLHRDKIEIKSMHRD